MGFIKFEVVSFLSVIYIYNVELMWFFIDNFCFFFSELEDCICEWMFFLNLVDFIYMCWLFGSI